MVIQVSAPKIARRLYRNAKGQFTSQAKWELEQRRGPGGRFVSKSRAATNKNIDAYLRAELGAPPAGKTWIQLASKYPEKFENYTEGYV